MLNELHPEDQPGPTMDAHKLSEERSIVFAMLYRIAESMGRTTDWFAKGWD